MNDRVVTLYKSLFDTENDWEEVCTEFGKDSDNDVIYIHVLND